MCLNVAEEEVEQATLNSATLFIDEAKLTAEQVEEEFKELVQENWDWKVKQLSDFDYNIVFPSKESLLMAIRGGGLGIPISKARALVMEGTIAE